MCSAQRPQNIQEAVSYNPPSVRGGQLIPRGLRRGSEPSRPQDPQPSRARANKPPLHYARALPPRFKGVQCHELFVFPEVTSLLAPGGSTGAARSVQGRVRGAAGGREDARGSGTLWRRCSRCPPASLPAPFPSSHPFSHVADVHEQG